MQIKEISIQDALRVNKKIPEFFENIGGYSDEYFVGRMTGKEGLIIGAFKDETPVGYMVSYNKEKDGSFYIWMTGVDPEFRRMGALKAMMDFSESWAKEQGYKKIKIKTRNSKRAMLNYLIKNNFNFVNVVEHSNDNRILLEKEFN